MVTKIKQRLEEFFSGLDALVHLIEVAASPDAEACPTTTPKTNLELAKEILTKNDYCHVHLGKEKVDERYLPHFRITRCPLCEKEKATRRALEEEKAKAARDIEIEFALNVMRDRKHE